MPVPSTTVDGHSTDSFCPSGHVEHRKHVTHSLEELLITFMAGSAQSSSKHDDFTLMMDHCQKKPAKITILELVNQIGFYEQTAPQCCLMICRVTSDLLEKTRDEFN